MMTRFVRVVASICILGICFFLLPSFVDSADRFGIENTAQKAGLKSGTGSGSSLVVAGANVVSSGLTLVSVLFFILMVYGGLKWMIARGNEEQVKKAINTIYGSVIGMIIVLSAYAITTFVTSSPEEKEEPFASGTWCIYECTTNPSQLCLDVEVTSQSQLGEKSKENGCAEYTKGLCPLNCLPE